MLAAEAAACAAEDGKFWDMHDRLFQTEGELTEELSLSYAHDIGLALGRFHDCLRTHPKQAAIKSEALRANALGVSGTPTFFVGTMRADRRVQVRKAFAGAASVEEFRAILDEVLGSLATRGDLVQQAR